jgi:hypothetical protein
MFGLFKLTQVKPRNRTCPVPRSGSSNHLRTCTAPARTCPDLWHPNGKIPFGGYKKSPMPPSLSWSLHCFENTLNQHFLSSKPLSFNLHSNPRFLKEIWAILLSDHLNLQAMHFTDNLRVFVTLRDLSHRQTRCCPGVTKGVVNLKKFVLPYPSWGFDSGKLN